MLSISAFGAKANTPHPLFLNRPKFLIACLLHLSFINHEASPFHDEPQTEIEGCKHEPRARGNYSDSSAV